jgi:hypothetical protein
VCCGPDPRALRETWYHSPGTERLSRWVPDISECLCISAPCHHDTITGATPYHIACCTIPLTAHRIVHFGNFACCNLQPYSVSYLGECALTLYINVSGLYAQPQLVLVLIFATASGACLRSKELCVVFSPCEKHNFSSPAFE